MTSTTTTTEERALSLLGSGIAPDTVASALGVSTSRISQLIGDEEFATKLVALRYENLAKHNARDNEYDGIEDDLIIRLKDSIPLMIRPEIILKAVQVINAAKRRGQSAPESITQQNTVVNLVMPVQIIQKFTTNINNQVVEAGNQKLVTIGAGTLLERLKSKSGNNDENGKQQVIEHTRIDRRAEEASTRRQEASGRDIAVDSVPAL